MRKQKKTLCEVSAHSWEGTAAVGWFRCTRSDCLASAICPGCLGYSLVGYSVQWCPTHYQTCRLEDFPVIDPSVSSPETMPAISAEQLSFWTL